jgi:hypothetical protein
VNLHLRVQEPAEATVSETASTSPLFRLVDVAASTLAAASPPEGHLAHRYVPLLRRMTEIILSGGTQSQRTGGGGADAVVIDANNLTEHLQSNGEGDLWEIWQQAGLDPIFYSSLFDDTCLG